jgi:hypothetical protein
VSRTRRLSITLSIGLFRFFAIGDEVNQRQNHTHNQNNQEVELLELPDVRQEEQTQHTQRNKLNQAIAHFEFSNE